MRNASREDLWKVWIYAAMVVATGAWISPFLYNAGHALAEVSSNKTTNGVLEWLAGYCRVADFSKFYAAGILLAAVVLFLPWMEWIHAKKNDTSTGVGGPWFLRLPAGARMPARGQPLRRNLRGLWQCCAGFLLVSGFLLSMGAALVPAGLFAMRQPPNGMAVMAFRTLMIALLLAAVMEIFFRGIVLGIFMRTMRPSAALGMSALFFSLMMIVIPSAGMRVADPESAGAGFELLRMAVWHFCEWRTFFGEFIPIMILGGVLAYARWRTASLWLPIGLHAGWIFAKSVLAQLSSVPGINPDILSGKLIQQGFVPLIAIVLAGILTHCITANHGHDRAIDS
ncbi:MAG: CPBP family intramembrane metalloprotease [Gloeobacteraceae cyanobacterium ES-bin-144]|nr:CPBP family intramembrane metalloprotease [Verrucomicrobiales bacterium]